MDGRKYTQFRGARRCARTPQSSRTAAAAMEFRPFSPVYPRQAIAEPQPDAGRLMESCVIKAMTSTVMGKAQPPACLPPPPADGAQVAVWAWCWALPWAPSSLPPLLWSCMASLHRRHARFALR